MGRLCLPPHFRMDCIFRVQGYAALFSCDRSGFGVFEGSQFFDIWPYWGGEDFMIATESAYEQALSTSLATAETSATPYRHWFVSGVFPQPAHQALTVLPFPVPDLGGVSGKREVHNATRQYFDVDNQKKYPVVQEISNFLQKSTTVGHFSKACDVDLSGTYLRLEYAQDTDGFWLEPHTDLGVKKFTMLIYLSTDPGHEGLGTDIYSDRDTHVGVSPFRANGAMIFIPGDNTWHGFEKRPIPGVRKSLILNYVTPEWRAREQLSFPDAPVTAA
jgi:hypothetical protein